MDLPEPNIEENKPPPTPAAKPDKRTMIVKLRNQNDKLKNELRLLTVKLEEFV